MVQQGEQRMHPCAKSKKLFVELQALAGPARQDAERIAAERDYQLGLSQKAAATTHAVKSNAMRAVASAVDTSFAGNGNSSAVSGTTALGAGVGHGTMLGGMSSCGRVHDGSRVTCLFNPNAWPRDESVHVTVWDAEPPTSDGINRRKQGKGRI